MKCSANHVNCHNHANPDRVRAILNHVLISQRLPAFASPVEIAIVVGRNLIKANRNGECRLSNRGEEILIELQERSF